MRGAQCFRTGDWFVWGFPPELDAPPCAEPAFPGGDAATWLIDGLNVSTRTWLGYAAAQAGGG
eukprot:SAG11_NODE_24099_length_378_cov_0.741935_1_plen_62_part_10